MFEDLDQVTVAVAFSESRAGAPDEVFTLFIQPEIESGKSWDERPYLDALLPLLEQDGVPYAQFHSLDIRKSQTSWGAAGAGAQIALFIYNSAASGVVGAVAWEGIRAAFRQIMSHAVSSECQPLTRDEAIAAAKWRVVMAYPQFSVDDLSVKYEEERPAQAAWVIGLQAADRTQFEVGLGVINGNPRTSHVRRQNPPDSNG
jgi:hypothetical protein